MAELVLHISVRTNNHSHLEALDSFFFFVGDVPGEYQSLYHSHADRV